MHARTLLYEQESIDPLAFMLEPSRDTTPDRSAGRVLEVAQVFGDAILDIRHYGRNEVVRLGDTADFYVPSDMLPSPVHPLFRYEDGAWICDVAPEWAGFVDRGEERSDFRDRMGRGERFRLDDDEVLVLDLGPTLFVARSVWRSRRIAGALERPDTTMLSMASLVGVLAALVGLIGARLPEAPEVSRTEMTSHLIDVMLHFPKPAPAVKREQASRPAAGGGGSKLEKKGPPTTSPEKAGVLDMFEDADVKSVFGDANLPSDMMEGVRNLIGTNGTTPGATGLAGRCQGQVCTGFGASEGEGIGDVGPKRGKHFGESGGNWERGPAGEIGTVGGEVILIGAIDKSLIDKVVKENLRAIKYCYQRELQKVPDLSGKVTVKFVIAGDGSVSSATTKTTTLGNPSAEACINGRFLRMQFPKPKGGGIAIVSYPFLFAPG